MRRTHGILAALLLASGCFVSADPQPYPPGGGTPVPVATGDGSTPLGSLGMPGYRVSAGASASVPAGDLGFVVTANGTGGYRLAWSDTTGSPVEFGGTITTDVGFDASQLYPFGTATVTQTAANQIDVRSIPGAGIDGVDLVSSSDPIYFDLRVAGQRTGFGIWFASALNGAQAVSNYDPVAFTSP